MGQTYQVIRAKEYVKEMQIKCCGATGSNENDLATELRNTTTNKAVDDQKIDCNRKLPNYKINNYILSVTDRDHIPNYLHMTDLNTYIKYKCDVYTLNNTRPLRIIWDISDSGIRYIRNINKNILPTTTSTDIINKDSDNTVNKSIYNVIFRTGGTLDGSVNCNALIFDENEINETKSQQPVQPLNLNECTWQSVRKQPHNTFKGYLWNLPNFPHKLSRHELVYSKEYGLITIGNMSWRSHNLLNLSFDSFTSMDNTNIFDNSINHNNNIKLKWKWTHFGTMKDGKSDISAVIINENGNLNGKELGIIMVSGCYTNILHSHKQYGITDEYRRCTNEVIYYDFQTKKFNKLAHIDGSGRKKGGIYYDNENNLIYFGGGDCGDLYAPASFEYYDINKLKWYKLPRNISPHRITPTIWKQDHILCIIDAEFGLEWLDLRESTKSWTKYKLTNDHHKLFGVKRDKRGFLDCDKIRFLWNCT